MKDVRVPEQLQRAMAAEAEAAREARAKVIAAEGEHRASRSLRHAAEVIMDSPAALQVNIYPICQCSRQFQFKSHQLPLFLQLLLQILFHKREKFPDLHVLTNMLCYRFLLINLNFAASLFTNIEQHLCRKQLYCHISRSH